MLEIDQKIKDIDKAICDNSIRFCKSQNCTILQTTKEQRGLWTFKVGDPEVDKALTELTVMHQELELLDSTTTGKSVVRFRVTKK